VDTQTTAGASGGWLDEAWQIIARELSTVVDFEVCTEYSASRCDGKSTTQTRFRLFEAEKLARMVVERYTIRTRMQGLVLNLYPKASFDVPLLTFQLGGQPPDKVLFVLDLIPLGRATASPRLASLCAQHRAAGLDGLEKAPPWLKEIASQNVLLCQYHPLEPARALSALRDYLGLWRDEGYLPGRPHQAPEAEQQMIARILKFKRVLHANDAGLAIYSKAFGPAMSQAIVEAAFGAAPAYPEPGSKPAEEAAPADADVGSATLPWDTEAEEYVRQAPVFVRRKIREAAEKRAAETGARRVTRALLDSLRK
jgi:hypothetical protein